MQFTDLILQHGASEILLSDNGKEFSCASNIRALTKLYNSTRYFCYNFQSKIAIEPGTFDYMCLGGLSRHDVDDAATDDNTQCTSHDYIGSMAFMPNEL